MLSGTFQRGWNVTSSISSEKIGVCLSGKPGDDALLVDDLVVLDHADHELRHVDPDVVLAEIVGHPAPLFHVGEEARRAWRVDVVERGARAGADDAVGPHALLRLEILDRLRQALRRRESRRPAPPACACRQRHVEPLPEQVRTLCVLLARHELRSRRHLDDLVRRGSRFQPLEIFLAQLLELRMLGMQAAQVGVRLGRGGDLLEHRLRIAELRQAIEI